MGSPFLRAIILLLLVLTACTPSPEVERVSQATATTLPSLETLVAQTLAVTQTPTSTTTATSVPSSTPTTTQTPTATPVPRPERPAYTLQVVFDYALRYATVEEHIRYTNPSGDPLPELRLMVPPAAYPQKFSITNIRWSEGALDGMPVEGAAWDDLTLRVPLETALLPGESISMRIGYAFHLPSQAEVAGDRPVPTGYTSRQANLVDWYLFVAPYRSGTGWLAHPPGFYGESLVYDLADFEVSLRLAGGPSELAVAASAPAEEDGEWLRYRLEGARNFALSIGSEYAVETAKAGDVTVSSYFFPIHSLAGKRVLQTTVEALELYEELFGPYPHDTLAVVEADFLDGMEYDGLYFLSKAFYNLHAGAAGDYLVAIAAHETAHQWWYALVGNDQANQPWLDEALSTYCERIFYERLYPEALPWWWTYRVAAEGPSGWVDSSIYPPSNGWQTYRDYRNAVYLNGAMFLEDLRGVMGDDAFFAFLKDYAARFAGEIATTADFFAVLSTYTQQDITPLMQMYFANPAPTR